MSFAGTVELCGKSSATRISTDPASVGRTIGGYETVAFNHCFHRRGVGGELFDSFSYLAFNQFHTDTGSVVLIKLVFACWP